MPIAREHRWLYPIDWAELTDQIRFSRAKGRCERCRRPHLARVQHLGNGIWWDATAGQWRDGAGRVLRKAPESLQWRVNQLTLAGFGLQLRLPTTYVVLATAHLNHDPGDNRPRNLAALCQRCHMIHDAPEHHRRRRLNAFRASAIGDLFPADQPRA
jgi:hypothetical protein